MQAKHERTKVKVGRWEVVKTPHHVYSGNRQCGVGISTADGKSVSVAGIGNSCLIASCIGYRSCHKGHRTLFEARRETIKLFGSTDTTQGGCHTAQGGLGIAQGDFQASLHPRQP